MLPPAVSAVVEHAAAPGHVARTLEQLSQIDQGLAGRLAEDAGLLERLVAVVGASRSLTRLLLTDAEALAVVADPARREECSAASVDELVRWKQRELLRIAVRDLTGVDGLEAVGNALARLAEDTLAAAVELPGNGGDGRLAVIGMGKLGGSELNYASDVDVLFVGDVDARPVLEVARRCFRVDADLRPEGRNGPLVRTLASYQAYWARWARTWEFQALLKARAVAGDRELGAAFEMAAAEQVWHRPFGAEELREVRAMKARVEGEVARRGLSDREVKRGRGGIRDVEFAVQLLQLVHGRHDPALRSATTLTALAELGHAGYLAPADADDLAASYRFLRTVEHRLQLADEQQVHAVPPDEAGRTRLARVLGYRDSTETPAVRRFDEDLRRHQANVRAIHERLFFRPLLEAFSHPGLAGPSGASVMPTTAIEERLNAFGFADARRTRSALHELTRGLTRSSRLMHQMLPLLLGWLSDAPDPDLGLVGLRNLIATRHQAGRVVSAFRDSPESARRLCLLLGTSRLLATGVSRHPEVITELVDDAVLRAPVDGERIESMAAAALEWRRSAGERRGALLRLTAAERLRIAVRDVVGDAPVTSTADQLSELATVVLRRALAELAPPVPMAIIAMGRFGGAELSYASDLDALIVYEGTTAADFEAAERTAESLLAYVNGRTPAERLFTLDVELRPEGRRGPLARSIDGYRAYYQRYARPWERQALVRARPVTGVESVGRAFMELVEEFVWQAPFTDADVRELRRIKARVERERIPAGEDPQFHLKLGRGSLSDVEWTAQLLQLGGRVPSPGTMAALDALVGAGRLDGADAEQLRQAYRFCEHTRNRWYLVKGAPGDALPVQLDQLGRLSRSLGTTSSELRSTYRRLTRRSRQVMERLFYGRT